MSLETEVPQIKLRPLVELVEYARNSRTHSPAQVEQLQRLIAEYGWTNPVLVDDNGIVAGHGRCMAVAEIYRRGESVFFPNGAPIAHGMVPTLDCNGWSDAQRRAYIIADNRSALSAGWDEEMLALELKELQAADFDLSLTAFNEDELIDLMAIDGPLVDDKDPDEVPEVPEAPASVLGDVWIMGPHRIICGDSTSPEVWDRLMQGERADVCFTDPPFNVDLGRKNKLLDKTDGGKRNANGAITNDKMTDAEFTDLIASAYACLFTVLKAGAVVYVAHADKVGATFRNEFERAGFHFSQMLIWNKGQFVLGMADFQPSHEPIMYGWKKGAGHRWYGGRKQRTVMDAVEDGTVTQLEDGRFCIRAGDQMLIVAGDATIDEVPGTVIFEPKPASSGLHPSTKPVALIERLIRNSSRAGDIMVDGFSGSGSSLIAAERMGMCARVVELEPKYTDVACLRYYHYTGRRPVHAVTGELFPVDGEVRVERPDPVDDGEIF